MPNHSSVTTNRPPKRLQQAQERGFLNARCARQPELLRAYGLWCWQMALPMVWYEARSRTSRLSRIHVDMLTTPFRLSVAGQAALISISAEHVPSRDAQITTDTVVLDRVSLEAAPLLARAIFRAIRKPKAYQLNQTPLEQPAPSRVIPFTPRLAVSA